MTRGRPVEVLVLTGMTAIATLACFAMWIWPISPHAPVHLDLGFGVLGAALTLGLWSARRVPAWALHAVVVAWLGGITSGILLSATPQGATGTAVAYTWTLTYSAHFFSPRQARAYTGLTVIVYAAASAARPFTGIFSTWAIITVTCLAGCELLVRMHQRLRQAALCDELTKQRNRAALVSEGPEAIRCARRHGLPVSLAVLDLDGFKDVNDRQGHAAGDALLRAITAEWRARLRPDDVLYRSGGDEFVVVMPATTADQARAVMTRLRAGSCAAWCFGVAQVSAEEDLDDALRRADVELYEAKRSRPQVPAPRYSADERRRSTT